MAKRTAQGAAPAASTAVPATGTAPAAEAAVAPVAPVTGSPQATDATATTDAAATGNAPVTDAAATTEVPAGNAPVAGAMEGSGVTAADTAKAPESASISDDEPEQAAGRSRFPLNVVIRNHATLAFSEPLTGAFVPGGGSATVTLHDEEFAERVAESLHNIVESNYLAPGALAVDPA